MALPPEDGEFAVSDLSTLTRRVAALKRQEQTGSTATIQVAVLDATLPGQRLSLKFQKMDVKKRLNAGTELGELAAVGDKYAMLGQAPSSGQVLPLGTEVEITRIAPDPAGTGDTEVELVGLRRLRIEGQPFNENGIAMAKVTFMSFAPEDTPPLPAEESLEAGAGSISGDHPSAGAAGVVRGGGGEEVDQSEGSMGDDGRSKAEECVRMSDRLEQLVDEWSGLVRLGGFERQPDQLQLIRSHIGPIPPADEGARRAAWVGALINPTPALGVAYEIRPALLMARDTHGMLRVATDGITMSIERLRKGKSF